MGDTDHVALLSTEDDHETVELSQVPRRAANARRISSEDDNDGLDGQIDVEQRSGKRLDDDDDLPVQEERASKLALIMYGLPQINIQLCNSLLSQWLTYYYLPPNSANLVVSSVFGVLLTVGRLMNAVSDPPMGYLSDRTTLRIGRRIPYIAGGAPLLATFFAALWFPPDPEPESTNNALFFVFMFLLYNLVFAVVTAPYTALSPEICKSPKDRVIMSTFVGVFSLVGNLVGALVGPFQSSYADGLDVLGIHFSSGLQFCGAMGGLLHLVGFMIPLLILRERPPERQAKGHLVSEFVVTLKNPAFRALMGVTSLLPMGVAFVAASLPYMCTQILESLPGEDGLVKPGQGTTWTGVIGIILIGGALMWMPVVMRISARIGKWKTSLIGTTAMAAITFLGALASSVSNPTALMLAVSVLLSLPTAVAFALPPALYCDVVDYDEQRSGVRREGMYAGALAFVNKGLMAIAGALIVYVLELGDTRENPLGIVMLYVIAGVVVAGGALLFYTNPIRT